MQWVTRDHIHFDRAASPWLIVRFVDPSAEFQFVPWDTPIDAVQDGVVAFAIPGAELGLHNEEGSTFRKIALRYKLIENEAISQMCEIVDKGVAFVLQGYRPPESDHLGQIAVGLLEISEGMMLLDGDDYDVLRASLPFYDALYRSLSVRAQVKLASIEVPRPGPKGPAEKIALFRELLQQSPVLGGV